MKIIIIITLKIIKELNKIVNRTKIWRKIFLIKLLPSGRKKNAVCSECGFGAETLHKKRLYHVQKHRCDKPKKAEPLKPPFEVFKYFPNDK